MNGLFLQMNKTGVKQKPYLLIYIYRSLPLKKCVYIIVRGPPWHRSAETFMSCYLLVSSHLHSSHRFERNPTGPTPHTRDLSEASAAALRCNVKRFKLVLSDHRRRPTHRDEGDCPRVPTEKSNENPISTEKSRTWEWIELHHLSIADCKSTKTKSRVITTKGWLPRRDFMKKNRRCFICFLIFFMIWQHEMAKLYKNI